MLSVADALSLVLAAAEPVLPAETVPLATASGRTLAAPLIALRTQPPFPASAMDGYALRAADATAAGATLTVTGTAAAGHAFGGRIGPGEAVRIFTGAPVPNGSDTVMMQEDTQEADGRVRLTVAAVPGRHVRAAGLDFAQGDALLPAGARIDPRRLALAAAMGHAQLPVHRRPVVGVLATGDELVRPGEAARADQIVASNVYAVAAIAEAAGGEARDLGIASDDFAALEQAIDAAEAQGVDVLVTVGGASVGDHDLVQSALARRGMQLGFWRIAMRPGKPLIFGRLGAMRILGLPGNPVSSIVCATLFLTPLLRALQGDPLAGDDPTEAAVLGADVPANDGRQDYVRARRLPSPDGPRVVPFGRQDSSMLRTLAEADCLLVRDPHAPAAAAGSPCRILSLAAR
jgi:molybdopterin molybdotransferase